MPEENIPEKAPENRSEFADRVGRALVDLVQRVVMREGPKVLPGSGLLPLLVALSGGPDSTSLLCALHAVSSRYGLAVHAIHFNHGQRGQESDGDEQFCIELCERLGVSLSLDSLPAANNKGEFLSESELRDSRYASFVATASQLGINFVVVGHTMDDQSETVLFRLFRGASSIGLAGIPAIRSLDDNISILRPILDLRHSDCLAYLADIGVVAREDSSNKDTRFARNFLRHSIVPLIEQRFPGFADRVDQLRQIMVDENEFLDGLATEALKQLEMPLPNSNDYRWVLELVQSVHPAVLRRAIVLSLRARKIEVTFERVEMIAMMCGHPDWQPEFTLPNAFSLNEFWDLRKESPGAIRWQFKGQAIEPVNDFEIPVSVPGTTVVPGVGVSLIVERYTKHSGPFPKAGESYALVDLSRFSSKLVIRLRRPGDVITPFGMNETVKLKKYLHTHKPELETYDNLVVANAEEVLWVPGVGLSEKLRVVDGVTHRLSLVVTATSAALAK